MALGIQWSTSRKFRDLIEVSRRFLILILVIGNDDHELHQAVERMKQGLSYNPRRVLLYFTIDQAKGFGVQEWSNNINRDIDIRIAGYLDNEFQFIFRHDASRSFQVLLVHNIQSAVDDINRFIT